VKGFRRHASWRSLAAAAVFVGAVGVGTAFRAAPNVWGGPLLQSQQPPAPAAPILPPKPENAKRAMLAEVTAISMDPASFIVRKDDGSEVTYHVLEATIFMAGKDRPYNFSLLNVGHRVRVKGNEQQLAAGQPARPNAKRAQMVGIDGNAVPTARRVIVRPAGENAAKVGKKGAADGAVE
jgi:hypothetical protein